MMRKPLAVAAVAAAVLVAAASATTWNPDDLTLTGSCYYDGSWKIGIKLADSWPGGWVSVTPDLLPGTSTGAHDILVSVGEIPSTNPPSLTFTKTVYLDGYCSLPPPAVVQSIKGGQVLKGTVSWTATPSAPVKQVVFALDGNAITYADTTAPYEYLLDTTKLSNGAHQFGLTVTLLDGSVVWQPYQIGTVTVDNPPPAAPPVNTAFPVLSGAPRVGENAVRLRWVVVGYGADHVHAEVAFV